MIFEDLKFRECKNGNLLAEVLMSNGYSLDIVKCLEPSKRYYKVKPFEETFGKKRYLADIFPEHGDYPKFNTKDALIIFLNEIEKHDLANLELELDEPNFTEEDGE